MIKTVPRWVLWSSGVMLIAAFVAMTLCGALGSGIIKAWRPESLGVDPWQYFTMLRKFGVWAFCIAVLNAAVLWPNRHRL
jgi:hypothetical protein